jgi:hypothetical protein
MAAQPSITIVKTFTYRGSPEEWSNTYHFTNDAPTTQVRWKALADAVIAAEKACFDSTCSVTSAYGHKAGVKARDWFWDYAAHATSVAGTLTVGTMVRQAGDAALWLRWPTDQLTSRGKPIYLRSYFHSVFAAGSASSTVDNAGAAQKTALETYGAAWIAGFSDGTVTHARNGPNGAVGLSPSLASSYPTTRTLERRGKRRPI